MKTVYKYWKNSNTGDLIMSQEFLETGIKGIPIYYYREHENAGENLELKGYVEVSEKTFKRESRKHKI